MFKLKFYDEVAVTTDEPKKELPEDKEVEETEDENLDDDEPSDKNSENSENLDTEEEEIDFETLKKEHKAYKEKVKHQDEFISNVYKDYGISDFESFEKQYNADLEKQRAEETENIYSQLEEKGIDRKELQDLISKLPQLQEVEKLKAELKQAKDFEEFKKDFPQYSKVDDLKTLPQDVQDSILDHVKRGYSLKESYILSNYKNLSQSAEQKALNKVNSKAHLKPGKPSADEIDMTIIDEEELKWYRALNPKASNKQIVEHFRKSRKGVS